MTRITWIGLGLLPIITAAIVVQSRGISALQREQGALQAAQQEARRLAETNRDLAGVRVSAEEIESLRQANRDLPRLRNEIRQLRDQQKDLEKLQTENQRLAEQLKAGVAPRKSIAELEGYVPRTKWAQVGFATPEALVQTVFWAMSTRNIPALADCLEPSEREDFLEEYKQMSEDERQRTDHLPANLKGFRIAEKKEESPDKIVLKIQAAADGELMEIPVRRRGAEWKLESGWVR
jgi:TolA-binding protein